MFSGSCRSLEQTFHCSWKRVAKKHSLLCSVPVIWKYLGSYPMCWYDCSANWNVFVLSQTYAWFLRSVAVNELVNICSQSGLFFSITCSPGPNLGRLLLVVLGAVLCYGLVAESLVWFFQVSRKMLNNLSLSSVTCEVRAAQLHMGSTCSSGPIAVECSFRSFKSKTRKLHCILKHLSLKLVWIGGIRCCFLGGVGMMGVFLCNTDLQTTAQPSQLFQGGRQCNFLSPCLEKWRMFQYFQKFGLWLEVIPYQNTVIWHSGWL